MLVSVKWLCELCPVQDDPDAIARALTDRGLTVDAVDRKGNEGDAVLDLDIPANRPDCLGHYGIARELSAAFGSAMKPAAGAGSPPVPPSGRAGLPGPRWRSGNRISAPGTRPGWCGTCGSARPLRRSETA